MKTNDKHTNKHVILNAFKSAFPYTLPIMASFFCLGSAYGIYMKSLGFSFWYPVINAIVIFGGSLEFVVGTMLLAPFAPLASFSVALVIQLRHLFYGISLFDKYKNMGWKKPYLIYALCDETFSINCAVEVPDDIDKSWFYFFVSILNQMYWVIGASFGALMGNFIGEDVKGIDFVMTSMFVAIFVEQLRKDKLISSALIGILVPIMSLIVFGVDNYMVPSIVGMLVFLLVFKKIIMKGRSLPYES